MFARKSLAKLGKNINPTFQVSSPKGNFYHHSASVKHKMKVCQDISEMRAFRESLTATVGFVPTMGSLHEGHLNLGESRSVCLLFETASSKKLTPTPFSLQSERRKKHAAT
eukprot:Sdes_comp17473_c0_seq1m6710